MPLRTTRFMLPAALLVFATDAALAGPAPQQIRIQCDQPEEQDICGGLRDAIALRFPDHTVVLSNDESATGGTTLRLVAEQSRADTVSGYLVWTTAEGKTAQSRALELSVMDAPLTAAMLRDFGTNLARLYSPQS